MTSPLENLSGPGKQLSVEPTGPRELVGLTRSGLSCLGDAKNARKSPILTGKS